MKRAILLAVPLLLLASSVAVAQLNIPSDGSDGVFNPTASVEVDLSQAVTAQWDTPSPQPGKGVYDPEKWAVVFKYSSVNIPSGVTVTFKNHPANPPVVWLVQGDVSVAGTVKLDGQAWSGSTLLTNPAGGPGGFRAGAGSMGEYGSGLGPGGGVGNYTGGSYGTQPTQGGPFGPSYGNAALLPLIGGSGGSAKWFDVNNRGTGSGGGGALLIAAAGTITIPSSGNLLARGGDAGNGAAGAGGAIRLVAAAVTGSGSIYVRSGSGTYGRYGGDGRVRLEALDDTYSGSVGYGVFTREIAALTPDIWPPATAPQLKVVTVGNLNAPLQPRAGFAWDTKDFGLSSTPPIKIRLQAENIPTDGTWTVRVRIAPREGQSFTADAVLVSGDAASSVWEAEVTMPRGYAAIQARAFKNP